MDVGGMISEQARDEVLRQIQYTVEQGAKLVCGGYKKSGIGREGSSRTLLEFTQEKSYVLKQVLDTI